MRITVEPSDYVYRNLGDTAMLTVALERIADAWPHARIRVFTDEPDGLPRPRKNVEPLPTSGRKLWFERTAGARRSWLRRRQPAWTYRFLRRYGRLTREDVGRLDEFWDAVTAADLLVATGMGGVTSAFPAYAEQLLDVVRCAQHCGVKTGMMGQGLGPLEPGPLRRAATATLRRLDLLALRERRSGLPLLGELRVPLDRVIVTGDDAIELACREWHAGTSDGIGINLRHARYADTTPDDISALRDAFARLSKRLQAPLVGVPISRVDGEADAATIAELGGFDAAAVAELARIRTPRDAVAQLQRCRVLVTGSYHAGVFALSGGVPTVALARSAYYVDKFLGLADMFGRGCSVVRLDEADFARTFEESVLSAWSSADDVRTPLRDAAQRQLAASRAAYAKLARIGA